MKRRLQNLKNDFLFALLAVLYAGLNALPLAAARAAGASLGRAFYWLVGFARRKALRQIQIAFPEWDRAQQRRIAREAMAHLGRGAAEFFRFSRLEKAELESWVAEVEGYENLERARHASGRDGRGVVFVTAHAGHWELLAAWTAQRLRVAVAARSVYDPRLEEKLRVMREAKGIKVFPRHTSPRPILRWLKEGGALGTLADQDTNVAALFVPFFGRLAKTPLGPAWLAAASGALLLTAFCWRLADGRYALRFEEEIAVAKEAARDAKRLRPAVEEYSRRIEAQIRRHPGQWAWIHERWRSQPDAS